jgi:AcrR family transcriptional regulator
MFVTVEHQTLRQRQKQVARDLMLQAAAELIAEDGLDALSLAQVAERAGVSKRTLYNYFDSREALLEDLSRWAEELTVADGGFVVPEGLDRLAEMLGGAWRSWAARETLFRAVTAIDAASNRRGGTPGRRRRRAALADAVSAVRPDLDRPAAEAIGSLFHTLASGGTFDRLTTEDGWDVDTAIALASWLIALAHESLAAGGGPDLPDSVSSPAARTAS